MENEFEVDYQAEYDWLKGDDYDYDEDYDPLARLVYINEAYPPTNQKCPSILLIVPPYITTLLWEIELDSVMALTKAIQSLTIYRKEDWEVVQNVLGQ